MTGRVFVVCFIVVAAMAGAADRAKGQEVTRRAMTREEIIEELKSSTSMKGEILYKGKLFCSFDTEKARTLPEGPEFPEPAKRVQSGSSPSLAVKLSRGGNAKRLLLVKGGKLDSKIQMALASTPEDPQRYAVSFDKPLEPGKYEFAVRHGQLVLWLRCGITVAEQ